jgi:hypothetical protein
LQRSFQTFLQEKSIAGNGVGILSEWGRGRGGRIDFRILGPKWVVEFLIDVTKATLNEHYGRFLPGGKYHWWILEGLMSDWVVGVQDLQELVSLPHSCTFGLHH